MKKINKILSAVLCALIAVSPVTAADNYTKIRAYNGEFTDISQGDWYYSNVVDAYSLGLISGKTDTEFAPDKSITIAETIKLAAVCHRLLSTGQVDERSFESSDSRWYAGYLSYSMQNGIVTEEYDDYNVPASRAQVAVLFSRAIVSSGIGIENLNNADFGDLPDVSNEAWYAGAVYKMYNWGIITGSTSGNINPTSAVKRSEIAAVLMRVIDPDERVTVGAESDGTGSSVTSQGSSGTQSEKPETSAASGIVGSSVSLYPGDHETKSFIGVTAFGGYFTIDGGVPSIQESYSIDLADDIILEKDNISFKLYKGEGYEALGIVRGWINEAACGGNGQYIREPDEAKSETNELIRLRIGGNVMEISELWYADHGEYTTYAFYFDKEIDLDDAVSVEFICGKTTSDDLRDNGKDLLADLLDETEGGISIILGEEDDTSADTSAVIERSEEYKAAIEDAKNNAYEILYEYECSRCAILYGRGLYGREANDYRLIFVFRDGSTQTVSTAKLDEIRMNSDGDVLYYKVTAPDGKSIQYGVNFE